MLLLVDLEGTKVKKGINILEETLSKNKGADATISISHKLYGTQKIIQTDAAFFKSKKIISELF